MKCPDITERYFVVYWMLNAAQAVVIIAIWELEKFLWRVARGRSPLTADPDDDSVDEK